MFLVTNTLVENSRKLSIILFMASIVHAAISYSAEYPDVPQFPEEDQSSDFIDSKEDFDVDSHYFDFEENSIEEEEYPYEILQEMVEETYELLKSDDEEKKRKLKIQPSDYDLYKSIAEGPFRRKHKTKLKINNRMPKQTCAENINTYQLLQADIHGTKCLIVNVDNFMQDATVRKCAKTNASCEVESILSYESKCEQSYKRVRKVCIPVGNELVKENQEVRDLYLPDGCICTLKRLDNYTHRH